MLQRYKLRLGDGTVLLVDHDGLGTWLVDGKAAVQAGKTRNWVPLRKFLSRDRAARRARSEAAAWASLSADAPKARRGGELPLVPPPPPRDETPPTGSPPPREDGLPLVPPPPPREVTLLPREDGLPLVPPPLPRDATPPPDLTPPSEDELPVDDSPLFAPAPSSEQVPADPHLVEPEAFVPPAPRLDEGNDPIVKITVGEPRVVQVAAEEPAEPGHAGEPHEIQALAEEPASSEAGSGPVADLPVIPFKPLEDDAPVRPSPLQAAPDGPLDGAAAREPGPTDDHLDGPGEGGADGAVPERPLEPRSTGTVAAHQGNRIAALDAGGPLRDALLQDGRGAAALRFAASFGTFLSRCLDPINRLERGLPPFPGEASGAGVVEHPAPGGAPVAAPRAQEDIPQVRPLAEEPSLVGDYDQGSSKTSGGPSAIRLKPLDGDEAPFWDPSKGQRLLARARAWVDIPATWVARRAARDRPEPPAEPESHRQAEPAPRETLQAPPANAELPVLRFATANEPAVVEDVYGGDETESLVPVAWLWTKRLALAAGLLAGATLAALTFETWSPRAAKIGEATLSEIDGRVRSHYLAGQRQEAVAEVADELPQLDPDTIGALMAASPTGLLDAAGVFEMARDATDRGTVALTADDARELEAVQQELLDGLLPAERERLREFDLARARGAVFPLDGQQALLVYARGARQLPPVSQEHLRLLLGRAIAAALAPPTQATTSGVGAR